MRKLLICFCSANCRTQKRLSEFKNLLAQGRTLPTNFTRDVIMKAPTRDMMNSLSAAY